MRKARRCRTNCVSKLSYIQAAPTNFKNHLLFHTSVSTTTSYSAKKSQRQPLLTSIVPAACIGKFTATSMHVKVLTPAVAEFIARDAQVIAAVDGVNLMH